MKYIKTFALLIFIFGLLISCSASNPLLEYNGITDRSPDNFKVVFQTTKGKVEIEAKRELSPNAVDRFYFLAKNGYYNENRFFRVVPNFVVQWGISGNPAVNKIWENLGIEDEPVKSSNLKGAIAFARGGKDSRSNQLFINLKDNSRLDKVEFMEVKGFPVFAHVVSGIEAIDSIFSEYRELPDQDSIQQKGNKYLIKNFPKLDYIISTEVIE